MKHNIKSSYPLLVKAGLSIHTAKTYASSLVANNKKKHDVNHWFTSSAKHPPAWMAICFFMTGIVLALCLLH